MHNRIEPLCRFGEKDAFWSTVESIHTIPVHQIRAQVGQSHFGKDCCFIHAEHSLLLVLVVALHREHIYQNFITVNGVDNPVSFIDSAGPLAGKVVLERLRFSYSRIGMFGDVF